MAFTPNFVDLVRNFTTTTGTGNFALGAAVSGFTSFTSALQAGDSFYYSAIGVDKPQEREVGRGTLQSNGTISRDPISGGKTNFTTGTKTISLIAAAEWFNAIQAGGVATAPNGAVPVASRAELAALDRTKGPMAQLIEPRREGTFVFDPSNLSAKVTGDPMQAIYVAPASDPSGASGAWVRRFSGPLNVKWFGAIGDGVANDHAAFAAALALAEMFATDVSGRGMPSLYVPAGVHFLGANTLEIVSPVPIVGENPRGSVLKWTSGTTGIRVQHGNTTGANGVQADNGRRPKAKIANLILDGGWAGVESDAHGIHARTAIDVDRVTIQHWPGEGIYLRADSSDGSVLGNCNLSAIRNVLTTNCRSGIHAHGIDVNACIFENIQGFSNRQCAVRDRSGLGNTYLAPLAEGNARLFANNGVTIPCSYVSDNGNRYFCIPGQEAWASVNAPSGTTANNQGWGYWQAGGPDAGTGIPPWSSGIKVRAGGGYFVEGLNNATKFENPYCEDDEISLLDQLAFVAGGARMNWVWRLSGGVLGAQRGNPNGPLMLAPTAGGLKITGNLITEGYTFFATPFFGRSSGGAANTDIFIDNTSIFNSLYFRSWNAGVAQTDGFLFTANVNAGLRLYGRDAIKFGTVGVGLATTDIISVDAAGLAVTGAVAVAGAIAATGTITSSGGAVGYAAGAGGAVTQATSKSTAVTLNKAAGQITTHEGELASTAVVSFTVNNSTVAATDTINLNLQSGHATAGAYRYWVEGIAAGSFQVAIENRSGGPLSEALTFNFAVLKAVNA